MTKRNQMYRCPVCGQIVEVVNPAAGKLVCCGQPMELLQENTTDAAHEKHVPQISRTTGGYVVTVGSQLHPMLLEHHIEWIELLTPEGIMREHLQPGQKPEATFCTEAEAIAARAYCNLHGLWKR